MKGRIRMRRTSITIGDQTEKILMERVKETGAENVSAYLTGLILLDFLRARGEIDASELRPLPSWILGIKHISLVKGKLRLD